MKVISGEWVQTGNTNIMSNTLKRNIELNIPLHLLFLLLKLLDPKKLNLCKDSTRNRGQRMMTYFKDDTNVNLDLQPIRLNPGLTWRLRDVNWTGLNSSLHIISLIEAEL